jgi:predicted porin
MDGVAFQMGYGAPAAIQGRSTYIINKREHAIGGNSIGSVNTAATQSAGGQDAEKINYYTPRIAGFQFGVSYTPDNCEANNANGTSATPVFGGLATTAGAGTLACAGAPQLANNQTQHSDIIDLSVNFVRTLFGIDLATNFFWTKGNLEGATGPGTLNNAGRGVGGGFTDRKEIGFGVNLSYMGFTLGGGWRRDNLGSLSNNTDRHDYAVGLRYRTGPWQFGVDYGRAEQGQGIAGAGVQVAAGTNAGDDTHERFAAGVDYTMGPGVRFYGGVMYFNLDDNFRNPANENDGVYVILGTRLDF